MTRAALALVLLAACVRARQPLCVSTCGARWMGLITDGGVPPSTEAPSNASCTEWQRAEDWILATAPAIPRVDSDAVCKARRGWEFYAHEQSSWVDGFGRKISGVTMCIYGSSQINNRPFLASTLAHESYHVAERCWPLNHEGWNVDGGINDSVNAVLRLWPDAGWPHG